MGAGARLAGDVEAQNRAVGAVKVGRVEVLEALLSRGVPKVCGRRPAAGGPPLSIGAAGPPLPGFHAGTKARRGGGSKAAPRTIERCGAGSALAVEQAR